MATWVGARRGRDSLVDGMAWELEGPTAWVRISPAGHFPQGLTSAAGRISGCGNGTGAMITVIVPNTLPKQRRDWIWPLVVAATIFLASSREANAPEFTRWIPRFDKLAHFSVYGLLGTLMLRGLGRRRWAPWLAIAAVSLFGASDEWHQSFVPGRSCEVADWVADTLGAALAVGLYRGWGGYRRLLESALVRPTRVKDGSQAAQ